MLYMLLPCILFVLDGDRHLTAEAPMPNRNAWGAAGLERVVWPYRLPPNTLTLTLLGRYGKASDFLLPGDDAQLLAQEAHVLWTPIAPLDVALSLAARNVSDASLPGQSAQAIGAPTLRFKWNVWDNRVWALGALFQIAAPSARVGLLPADAAWTLLALGAWHPAIAWTVAFNTGFIYDRGADTTTTPQSVGQRFASQLNLTSRIAMGLGASWEHVGPAGALRPFLEANVEAAVDQVGGAAPVWITGGLQWQPPRLTAISVTGGVDARLSGAPGEHSAYAGLLPWTAYARLTVTTHPEKPISEGPGPLVLPVVAPSVCPSETAAQHHERFATRVMMHGQLTNKKGEKIHAPTITIDRVKGVNFQFDPKSGEFSSEHFDCDADEKFKVTVAMPGFVEETHEITCQQLLQEPNAMLTMTYSQKPVPSAIHCVVLDARTSQPIEEATVLVEGFSFRPVRTDEEGVVTLRDVPAGTYKIVIQAPHHRPQRRTVALRKSTMVILNIDLRPIDAPKHAPVRAD